MRSSTLKRFRLFFALLFIISTTSLFLDFRGMIPEEMFGTILYLQFVPSLINFITSPAIAAGGFLFVLILTFATGRTYCSAICPLGIMQDAASRVGGKYKKRFRRFGYGKPFNVLRYTILGATMILLLTGGIYLVTLLDPYSIYGRFSTMFFKPLLLYFNNLAASVLANHNIFIVYNVDIRGYAIMTYLIPLLFLFLVLALSMRRGRLYCNTVCPVGTLLGIISKVSLFRITIDNDCSRCGRCAVACKASCIDFLNRNVDLSRCVGCFNCIGICPDKAVSFSSAISLKASEAVDNPVTDAATDRSKREFLAGTALLTLFAGAIRVARAGEVTDSGTITTVREEKNYPVTPPGSVSLNHFLNRCTACSLCVAACPTRVIQPSVREYGIAGIMQPHLDFHKGFCNFDCTICSDICPTGAIMPLGLEAKQLTQIGKAVFIKENCVVNTDKTDCGACSEHCPTKAVEMVPFEENLLIPEVTEDLCVGCGACEYACPTIPYRAIFVDGNKSHIEARKPETERAVLDRSDFPF